MKKASTKKPAAAAKPAAKKAPVRKAAAQKPASRAKAPKTLSQKYYAEDKILARAVADVLALFNGKDVEILDLKDISPVSNFFVIATSNSGVHARGMAEKVRETLKKDHGLLPRHVEGVDTGLWIVMDYLGVVVHIFSQDLRDRYALESLWKGEITRHENS